MAVIYGCYLCYDKKQRCSAAHSLSRCATVKGGISMKIRTKAVSLLLTVLLVFGVYAIVPPAAFAEERSEETAQTGSCTEGNP